MKAQNQDYPLLPAPEQSNEPRHPLGRPLSGNRMERIVITPVVATALLESFSRKNRNISENHVNKVAGSIRLGHWVHSSSVIHLSGDGTLQDGYHRMYACIKAGVPFETWVEFDCHEKTFETVDHVSRPRSYADNLRAAGESSALCLAASVNLLANWLNGCRNTSLATTSLDSDSLAAVLAVHPHLRDSVAATQPRDFGALAAGRVLAVTHYLFGLRSDEQRGEFFGRLRSGENLAAGSPILALRKKLYAQRNSPDSRGRMALRGKDSESLIYSLNLFVRSWNHYRKNTEVSQLIVPRRDHGSKSVCDDVPEIR